MTNPVSLASQVHTYFQSEAKQGSANEFARLAGLDRGQSLTRFVRLAVSHG